MGPEINSSKTLNDLSSTKIVLFNVPANFLSHVGTELPLPGFLPVLLGELKDTTQRLWGSDPPGSLVRCMTLFH